MKFGVYQVSRRGGREKNEDRMGYCYTRDAVMFALADGMGGHPEGEVAAQIALQTVAAMFQRDAKPMLPDPVRFLEDAVLVAHQQLLRYGADKGLSDTPRTTIVVCVLQRVSPRHWLSLQQGPRSKTQTSLTQILPSAQALPALQLCRGLAERSAGPGSSVGLASTLSCGSSSNTDS